MQKRSLLLLSSLAAAIAAGSACSAERTSTVLGPTTTSSSAGKSSAPSLLGTWVVQGASSTPAVTASSVTVPDFSSCSNFTWSITNQTATEASGRFSAECGTGLVFSGTITGRLGGATIPIVVTGALTRGSDTCQFSLNGEGTQIDGVTFRITTAARLASDRCRAPTR